MFERFDDGARRAVVLAQGEAVRLGSGSLAPEHLLLGVLEQPESAAAALLEGLGVSLAAIRPRLEQTVGRNQARQGGRLPFDPATKKAVERALREALDLGGNYVGTQHLLLGLLADRDGASATLLRQLGVERAAVWEEVRRMPRQSAPDEPGVVRPPGDVAAMRHLRRMENGWHHLTARLSALVARAPRRRR